MPRISSGSGVSGGLEDPLEVRRVALAEREELGEALQGDPPRPVAPVADRLEEVVRLVERYLGRLEPSPHRAAEAPPSHAPAFVLRQKDGLEQAHVVIGSPCPAAASPDRYAANLMTSILGDGMSSRLFQRIREERGLVYGIYSSVEAFVDAGVHMISAGASPENIPEVVELDEGIGFWNWR